jgi:unsaturated chondroitin disaccharide hydrolase
MVVEVQRVRTKHGTAFTPVGEKESRPQGMLVGACFNKRRDARARDSATNAETIFGSYYLFESLNVLDGLVEAEKI